MNWRLRLRCLDYIELIFVILRTHGKHWLREVFLHRAAVSYWWAMADALLKSNLKNRSCCWENSEESVCFFFFFCFQCVIKACGRLSKRGLKLCPGVPAVVLIQKNGAKQCADWTINNHYLRKNTDFLILSKMSKFPRENTSFLFFLKTKLTAFIIYSLRSMNEIFRKLWINQKVSCLLQQHFLSSLC